jgi:hypothetical protein
LSAVSCGDADDTERVKVGLGKVVVLFFDHGDDSRWTFVLAEVTRGQLGCRCGHAMDK